MRRIRGSVFNKPLLFIFILVALYILAPVQLVYIDGTSMEPTIPNGGLILINTHGTANIGDVVTFYSSYTDNIITHRITETTPNGFITLGDNNNATDQAVGHNAVKPNNILGTVVSAFGQPLYIPYLGYGVEFFVKNRLQIISGVLILTGIWALFNQNTRSREQSHLQANDVIEPVFASAFIILTLGVIFSSSTIPLTYVATTGPAVSDTSVPVGEESQEIVMLQQPQKDVTVRDMEFTASGVSVVNKEEYKDKVKVTVSVPSQEKPGVYKAELVVYIYPKILPSSMISFLHSINPVLVGVGTSAFTLVPFYILSKLLVDSKYPLRFRYLR